MSFKHWVNKEQKPMSGKYYSFKTFKVYWAYRWFIAKQLDTKGFIRGDVNPLDATERDIIYTNYALKYEN